MAEDGVIDDVNYLLSILYFTMTLLGVLYVFCSLMMKLDKAAIVVSLSYLVSTLFRTPLF